MFRAQYFQPFAECLLGRIIEFAKQIDEIILCWKRTAVRRLALEAVETAFHVSIDVFRGEFVTASNAVDLIQFFRFFNIFVGDGLRFSPPDEFLELIFLPPAADFFQFRLPDL